MILQALDFAIKNGGFVSGSRPFKSISISFKKKPPAAWDLALQKHQHTLQQ